MTIEVQEDVVDDPDEAIALAASGRAILDILPHRGVGKYVHDTVLSLPSKGKPPVIMTAHVEEFDPEELATLLQRVNDNNFDIFRIIPHRHGNVVRLTVYGVSPMNVVHYDWHVERCRDYETGLTDPLLELHQSGWLLFDIMPHRIGHDNFPVLIMRRPQS